MSTSSDWEKMIINSNKIKEKLFTENDQVNHPNHYGGKDNPYEAIKIIRAVGFNFNLGNCYKYIARSGKKDPSKTIEDLKKAMFYLQDEIQHLEGK